MAALIVWVLNLDAEDELAHRRRAFVRSRTMSARIKSIQPALAELVGKGNILLEDYQASADSFGRAWCPTPAALSALREKGVQPPRAPSFEVLRAVNHRSFCAKLGQTLPRARWIQNESELADIFSSSPGSWVLKRPFGFAGRGRRVVNSADQNPIDRAWITASLARDALQVEPYVERVIDVALHGYLDHRGELRLGAPTVAVCDDRGAWINTRRATAGELTLEEDRALHLEAGKTAAALTAAGYFGAFNLDAYRWRDAGGETHFQPRSEINARYSMGWAKGMGEFRPPAGEP